MKKLNSRILLSFFFILGLLLIVVSCGRDDDMMGGGSTTFELKAPASVTISSIGENSFRVEWTAVAGADIYEATVALDNGFANPVQPYDKLIENGTGINVISLNTATKYYVRIRTVIDGENTDFSSTVDARTLSEPAGEPTTPLKGAATTFSVGMAVRAGRLTVQHDAIFRNEFNSVTSEYEMKIKYPSEGNYDFSKADAIVDYAVANGMYVYGHALIWHAATPSWVENFRGTDAEFEAMIEDYIKTKVTSLKRTQDSIFNI